MYKLPETLTEDIANFGTLISDFKQNKVEPVKFKAIRVPMGVYEQRKDQVYMVRVRTTGGVISPRQLIGLIDIARRHHSNLLHITTRQEIQLQNLSLDEIEVILVELQAIGLTSRGGGGNTIRNILVSVNSGISEHEVFDPTPHAIALTSKLIAENDSFTLPRKLKIAFSNQEAADYASVNDLGFVARIKDGKRGFKVFMGGSVASQPTVGWVFSEFLPEEHLFAVAEAVKRFFSEHGNRKNKHKARLRHIFYRLGSEAFFALFDKYYQQAIRTEAAFYPEPPAAEKRRIHTTRNTVAGEAFEWWRKRYASRQRQAGLYSIIVPFTHGNIRLHETETVDKVLELLQLADSIGEDTIRFSTTQHIHLRNIPENALIDVYDKVKQLETDVNMPLIVNRIVSCTGADTCRLGICLSKGLASAIRRELIKKPQGLDAISNVRIQISGCPNSCGQQVWADLGFSGKVLRNDRIYPAYQVYAGAARGAHPVLAQSVGNLSARDIPGFVSDLLADYSQVVEQYPDFRTYILSEGQAVVRQLLEKYREVPAFEVDKNYYFDWGSDNLFSVADRGVAECSAGLFDMIDLDLKYIKQYRDELTEETDTDKINKLLHNIVYSSSRMLLITRGVEPKTVDDSFDLFISHFIAAGIVDKKYTDLVRTAREEKNADFSIRKNEVYALADTVIDLYRNMDDSLQFKNLPLVEPAEKEAASGIPLTGETAGLKKFKDLRGVACPMNFVQTKIQLSAMQSDELLEIWLDDGQPIQNVPGSVRSEGHDVLEQTQLQDYWKVVIRKK
jgi:sulfite reductase (ferredoxin)